MKTKWKHYAFIPEGAPPGTRGICYRDDGFLFLCEQIREGRRLAGYSILDTKFRPDVAHRNDGTDWTGFKEALWKEKNRRKPSVFARNDDAIGYARLAQARRNMLWSLIREYSVASELAMDILALLAHGRSEELEEFELSIQYRKAMIVMPHHVPGPPVRALSSGDVESIKTSLMPKWC